ncbi:MAG: glycosyltransferase, partial [Bacteroidota bacterium]
ASGIKIPVNYIEPQSALKDLEINSLNPEKYDYLFLLSGTEPQRSILEKSLLDKFELSTKKIILVRGSDSKIEINNKNISVINLAFGIQLKNIILSSETIICRSGYSTLMDLHVLNKNKLILIPTPGQTEQEYLASYWEKKFGAKIFKQNNLEI